MLRNPARLICSPRAEAVQKLQAGKTYEFRMDYVRYAEQDIVSYGLGIGLTFADGKDKRQARAVELAKRCDVALVFAGYPEAFETEGTDRPSMDLMGKQNELIAAVAAANPRTVVVLNAGAPVSMPWVDQVGGGGRCILSRHGKRQCRCECAVGQRSTRPASCR